VPDRRFETLFVKGKSVKIQSVKLINRPANAETIEFVSATRDVMEAKGNAHVVGAAVPAPTAKDPVQTLFMVVWIIVSGLIS
jgi:hypothetical protein